MPPEIPHIDVTLFGRPQITIRKTDGDIFEKMFSGSIDEEILAYTLCNGSPCNRLSTALEVNDGDTTSFDNRFNQAKSMLTGLAKSVGYTSLPPQTYLTGGRARIGYVQENLSGDAGKLYNAISAAAAARINGTANEIDLIRLALKLHENCTAQGELLPNFENYSNGGWQWVPKVRDDFRGNCIKLKARLDELSKTPEVGNLHPLPSPQIGDEEPPHLRVPQPHQAQQISSSFTRYSFLLKSVAALVCAFLGGLLGWWMRGKETLPKSEEIKADSEARYISEGEQILLINVSDANLMTKGKHDAKSNIDVATNSYASRDYAHAEAMYKLIRSHSDNYNPEVQIYQQNALVRRLYPFVTAIEIAVVVPAHSAVEILRGVAQAVNDINFAPANTHAGSIQTPQQEEKLKQRKWGLVIYVVREGDAGVEANNLASTIESQNNHSIRAVIGHFGSKATADALTVYATQGLVCLSPTSTANDLTSQITSNGWFFRTCLTNEQAATKLSTFFQKKDRNGKILDSSMPSHNIVAFQNEADDYSKELCKLFCEKVKGPHGHNVLCDLNDDSKFFHASHLLGSYSNLHDQPPIAPLLANPNILALFPNVETRTRAQLLVFNKMPPSITLIMGGDSVANPFGLQYLDLKGRRFIAALSWVHDKIDPFSQKMTTEWGDEYADTWRMVSAYEATKAIGYAIEKGGAENISREDLRKVFESKENWINPKTRKYMEFIAKRSIYFEDGNRKGLDLKLCEYKPGEGFREIPLSELAK